MFYKHWKIIALALTALIWDGCSDDSSSNSKEPIACELDHMWSPDDPSCTKPYSCTETYYCHDKVVCFLETDDKTKTFDCRDEQDNKTIYNFQVYTQDQIKTETREKDARTRNRGCCPV